MKVGILYRYIFREMFFPFLISLLVLTGLLFLVRILRLVELVVHQNVNILEVGLLFSYVVPRFFEIALPMSILIGIIVAFGRLSADSEIVVLRASGLSLNQLVAPVLLFATLVSIFTLITTCFVTPRANYQLNLGIFRLAQMKAHSSLVPGVFNEFGPLTVYAENISNSSGKLEHLLISDQIQEDRPKTSIAKSGQLISDEKNRQLTLRLYEGSIYEGSHKNFNITSFDIENVNLSSEQLGEGEEARDGKYSNELPMNQLSTSLKNLQMSEDSISSDDLKLLSRYKVEWHRRLVLPMACICLSLLGLCLGIQPSRGEYSWGTSMTVTLGILVIVAYYLLLALATALGKQAIAPAWFVMWLPNIACLALSLFFLKQISSERWLGVGQKVAGTIESLVSRIKILTGYSNV